jgi:hypothetical protein
MTAQATACVLRVKAPESDRLQLTRHFLPQLIAGLPVYPPHRAMPRRPNAQVRTNTGAKYMQLRAKVVDRGELIINCLAILALLAAGVVWGPV